MGVFNPSTVVRSNDSSCVLVVRSGGAPCVPFAFPIVGKVVAVV